MEKIIIAIVCVLVLFSCKEKACEPEYILDDLKVTPAVVLWNPYRTISKLVFENEENEKLVFFKEGTYIENVLERSVTDCPYQAELFEVTLVYFREEHKHVYVDSNGVKLVFTYFSNYQYLDEKLGPENHDLVTETVYFDYVNPVELEENYRYYLQLLSRNQDAIDGLMLNDDLWVDEVRLRFGKINRQVMALRRLSSNGAFHQEPIYFSNISGVIDFYDKEGNLWVLCSAT